MIRVGLVGTGKFARTWLAPALRTASNVRFRSVLSRDLGRARAFAEAEKADVAHEKLADFLADPELDAVWVATPDPTHEDFVLAAARARKHVLCEKPLATTSAAARRMRDACLRANVRLGLAYHCRHHPAHEKLFELIREGKLGRVLRVRVRFTFQMPDATNWRCGPPNPWWTMAAIGTHLVDLAGALVGNDEVKDVLARFSSPVFGAANEEIATVSLAFQDGATADIDASMVLPPMPPRLEVLGTKGWACSDGTIGPRGADTMLVNGEPLSWSHGADPYRRELEDFARACEEGRDPTVNGVAGARNDEALEAAARAARERRRVTPERA